MISFEQIDLSKISCKNIDKTNELNIYQSAQWLNFLAETQKAEPIAATVKSNSYVLGYFTGLIVRKYGIKILGSPFRGWTTDFMGLSPLPDSARQMVMQALLAFAFEDLGCQYIEIIDLNLNKDDCSGLPYKVENLPKFVIDVTQSEENLFSNMKHSCRNSIRKAIKSGVVIEEAHDLDFAEDYYSQLNDVFEKQSLSPPYRKEHVKVLIERLNSADNLLLLRARNPEGKCIATGIFLALNINAVFWGAASLRQHQNLRPNELLAWYGMKYWKSRGIINFHFGGGRSQYKKKFGSREIQLLRLMKAKYGVIELVQKLVTYPMSNEAYKNWMLRKFLN